MTLDRDAIEAEMTAAIRAAVENAPPGLSFVALRQRGIDAGTDVILKRAIIAPLVADVLGKLGIVVAK